MRLEIAGFGEFHPRQANDTPEGRNANRRVAILVLEQVSPGDLTAVVADRGTPREAADGVELADGASAGNRLLPRVPPENIEKAVRTPATPAH